MGSILPGNGESVCDRSCFEEDEQRDTGYEKGRVTSPKSRWMHDFWLSYGAYHSGGVSEVSILSGQSATSINHQSRGSKNYPHPKMLRKAATKCGARYSASSSAASAQNLWMVRLS